MEHSVITAAHPVTVLTFWKSDGRAVLELLHDGRIFWHGREVTGDDEFRRAMIDLRDLLASRGL